MREERISINGLEVNYKIFEEGNRGAREAGGWLGREALSLHETPRPWEGCSLLILHGWGGSSGSWVEVSEHLAKRGLKVIVPDLPGFGKSISPSIPWEVKDYSNFLFNFIEKIGIAEANLMGHSFGGRITIKFATLYPQKFKNLILCASAGIKHPLTLGQKIVLNLSLIGNFLFSKRPLKRFKDIARNIFYSFLRKKDYAKVKGVMKETFQKVVAEDLRAELSKIKTRTLIIWGQNDKSVPLEDAYLMKEKIPQSTLEILPKVGHTPNLEEPEKLAEIIFNFIRTEKS